MDKGKLKIAIKILTFAFPLFLGNLFQQFYNIADSLIVGNFIGSDALAAVSSSGSLIFLLVCFFNGISVGAGKISVPMFVMLVCWCIIRVSYITIIVKFIPMIQVIFWAYPLTWSLSSIVFTIYYFKSDWMQKLQTGCVKS